MGMKIQANGNGLIWRTMSGIRKSRLLKSLHRDERTLAPHRCPAKVATASGKYPYNYFDRSILQIGKF